MKGTTLHRARAVAFGIKQKGWFKMTKYYKELIGVLAAEGVEIDRYDDLLSILKLLREFTDFPDRDDEFYAFGDTAEFFEHTMRSISRRPYANFKDCVLDYFC